MAEPPMGRNSVLSPPIPPQPQRAWLRRRTKCRTDPGKPDPPRSPAQAIPFNIHVASPGTWCGTPSHASLLTWSPFRGALCSYDSRLQRDAVFNSPLIHSHQYFTALAMISLIKTLLHIFPSLETLSQYIQILQSQLWTVSGIYLYSFLIYRT